MVRDRERDVLTRIYQTLPGHDDLEKQERLGENNEKEDFYIIKCMTFRKRWEIERESL